jgi:hypothetical protein
MVPGFNSTVIHAGVPYHVQTEDLGDRNPCILILVYRAGAIVGQERIAYQSVLGSSPSLDRLQEFLDTHHRRALRRVAAGEFSESPRHPLTTRADSPASDIPPSAHDLDRRIDEYVRKRIAQRHR